MDTSLVSIDSTTARAHHDAAGMHLNKDTLVALEKAAAEEKKPGPKRAAARNKAGRRSVAIPRGKSETASDAGTKSV